MGFEAATYDAGRDRGESPFVWYPEGVKEQQTDQEHINVESSEDIN
jgi:hypothetical protein